MNTIFKYTLKRSVQEFEIPCKQILSAINQREDIVIYALVDSELEPSMYRFVIVGTGLVPPHEIDINEYTFLDTVSTFEGDLIWHVFYKKI